MKIRNTGRVVDQFTIDVVGDAGGWATCDPPSLNLFPGAEGSTTVRFQPPRSSAVAAGDYAFGVRAYSQEDPDGSVVEEGSITVSPFIDTEAELLPHTSRGRRRAVHEVAIDNRGNTRLVADLSAVDADDLLQFDVDPPSIVSEPGTATFAKVRLKPRKRFFRGAPKTLPFRVVVSNDGLEPSTADGAMVQEQLLPKWLIPALAALIALVILAIILWFTILKPTVKSAAKDAVKADLAASTEAAQAAQKSADSAADAAKSAADDAAKATGQPTPSTTVPGQQPPASNLPGLLAIGDPIDFRLSGSTPPAPPGTFKTFTFAGQPTDKALLVTDLVFQNPRGDSGTLQVRRGDSVLMEIGLGNFRDLDYHFVAPLVFAPGQKLTFAVECLNIGSPCTPAAYISGVVRT